MARLSIGEKLLQNAWRLAPKGMLTKMIGWAAKRELPARLQLALLRFYARAYCLNCDEAELPTQSYPSLQAFFTRRLKANARTMPDDASLLVAPCDGAICEAGLATNGKLLEAKGSAFTLQQLLADGQMADRMLGAPYVVIYLSPRDYHRVHTPVAGRVVSWTHIPGKLFPVGQRSVKREPGIFVKNERFVTVMETAFGLCIVVMVAAVGVGHITASYDPEVATHDGGFVKGSVRKKMLDLPPMLARGDELGVFNLGSTTITLFEPGRVELFDLVSGAEMKMGTPVGRIIAK